MSNFYLFFTLLLFTSVYSFGQTIYESDNKKWGLKNTDGRIIIPAKYDNMVEFSNPLSGSSNHIAVTLNNQHGVIERKTGKEIVPAKYEDIVLPLKWDLWGVKLNGKWGYINPENEVIIPFIYNEVDVFSSHMRSGDNIIARVIKDGKEMYIDKKGNRTFNYDGIGKFHEGLAVVYNSAGLNSDILSYNTYIDEEGNEILPLQYEAAKDFKNGVGILVFNNKWGAVDRQGKTIIPFEYDQIITRSKSEIGYYIAKKNKKIGIIDKNNTEITPIIYDGILGLHENTIIAIKDKKYGYLNEKYKEIIPFEYDFADRFSEDYAVVKRHDYWEILEKKGQTILSVPLSKYDKLHLHKEGLIGVEKNEKCGFIDLQGKEIIPLTYETVALFSNGLSMVKLDGKWGAIDKTGKIIYEIKYPNAFVLNDEMNKK